MFQAIQNNPVIDAILSRQTIREYTGRQISEEQLQTLMAAALLAPSGRNSQPIHVRFLQNAEMLVQMNTDFKNHVGWDTPAYTRAEKNPFYHNAPTFAFLFSETDSAVNAGIMAENICIAAVGLGLGCAIIASAGALFDSPQASHWKQQLRIPENYRFQLGVALGYADEKPEPKPRRTEQIQVVR